MIRSLIISAFVILCFIHLTSCVKYSTRYGKLYSPVRNRINADDYDPTDDSDGDDDDRSVELPLRPRRPLVKRKSTATTLKASTTIAPSIATKTSAQPSVSCSAPLPQVLLPSASSAGSGDVGWHSHTSWLMDIDPDGRPVTGGVVTIDALGASSSRIVRLIPASLPLNCQTSSGSAVNLADLAAANDCEAALTVSAAGAGCAGQLVSDGRRLLEATGERVAHFGITKSGQIFFGYSVDKLNPFKDFSQVLGGRGWIVRNGKNFVSQSLQLEACSTGSKVNKDVEAAAAALSARSAVCRNQAGQMALVHIVGRQGVAGLSLSGFADLLIRLGMREAINLDGGEAGALLVNGTLIGSPSAKCATSTASASPIACLRPAAAVLCVSRRRSPQATAGTMTPRPGQAVTAGPAATACTDASGAPCSPIGGRCVSSDSPSSAAVCVCLPYFEGPGCARRRCLCLNGGQCQQDSEACQCPPGYSGPLCERTCPAGLYGINCARVCVCAGGQSVACNPANGTCYGDTQFAKNESSLLRSIQQRLRSLGSINLALVGLSSALSLSLLFNLCLLIQCCRLRCRRRRHGGGSDYGTGKNSRYQPMRLVPSGRESDSDPEAVM